MAVGVGKFGPVRAYSLHDNEWYQVGQDLDTSEGAKTVALSRNHGHIMAIASESDGSVAVFQYDRGNDLWGQVGGYQEFGVTNHDGAKASVSLSYDRKALAIGVPSEGTLRSDSVRVKGYDADVKEWVTIGEDIHLPESERIQHGGSVSLSSDGIVLAVGSWIGEVEVSTYASHAQVYHFVDNAWQPLGRGEIGSRISPEKSQVLVSLSGDGTVLAVGSGFRCRVFRYDPEEDDWIQIGQDVLGRTVSISVDGKILAVGNPLCDEHGRNTGETVIYALNEETTTWTQVGESIPGEAAGDYFGDAVSLDGKRVAVGAPWSGGNADKSGSVGVYQLV